MLPVVYAVGYTQSRSQFGSKTTIRRFPVAISVNLATYQGGDVVDHDGNVLRESNIINLVFGEANLNQWLLSNPPIVQEVTDLDTEGEG